MTPGARVPASPGRHSQTDQRRHIARASLGDLLVTVALVGAVVVMAIEAVLILAVLVVKP